ncbi:ARM repeat-containing protein [Patellaria atrata CBS 101060]|uniref:ARM repeat-containing protein n=1 Tax=Patellaria atrata CBS 101060 TaxID=1346257 RepID=A0A9P4SES6_9PEZI|nr:ARM repeat-containing protein [Patellaria atrata CBS 101060]
MSAALKSGEGLKTRASSTRTSAHAVDIPDEGPDTSLRNQISSIFTDTQRSTAIQRKLVINLRKIHEACCYEPVKPKKKHQEEDFGEAEFNEEIGRCMLRVLPVKKSEPVGDKVVRFLGLFLKHASDKDSALIQTDDADTTDAFPETPATRLTSHIITMILPLLLAKDKTVRFRATQIIAHIVNTLDSIDDELFGLVRLGLLRRLRDKESSVRVQAILGLGRLAGEGEENEDEDSDDEDSGGVLEKLLDVLQNDPSADVRRSLLLNLPFTPSTLPFLLERARDFDPATRRALYARLLPALGDFRHLSLTHREKLLRWGLRDRDENVRKATARLFRERWIEDCAGLKEAAEECANPGPQVSKPSLDALLELLERIDVVNSGVEGGVAFEAMKQFWDGRPDYCDYVSFPDSFWDELTPEGIFIARTFNDYCRQGENTKLQGMVEDKMPEVTKFAYLLQKHLNVLIEDVRKVALQEDVEVEEDTVQQEFCVEQLLHIALTLDYSDEVGRRMMFSVMREALAIAELPEECTKLAVEVLRTVCGSNAAGEREFCGIVLEAVAEVHDTIIGEEPSQLEEEGDDSFHSAQSELSEDLTLTKEKRSKKSKSDVDESEYEAIDEEKAIREIMVNMKCLHIAQCMLQNVSCDLEANSHLVTMLNNLVVPAVRSQEAPIRERGLLCLGLCCLLSKNLAEENLSLFLHCFTKGHDALQMIALQIISDILSQHPSLLSPIPSSNLTTTTAQDTTETASEQPSPFLKPITKSLLRALRSSSPSVSLTATTALAKLMLLNILRDPDVLASILKHITIAFFSPETAENPGVRQALSYFLPVYCHSRRQNAEAMARVAVQVVISVAGVRDDLEEDEMEGMVGLGVVGGMLVEWTDPRRVVGFGDGGETSDNGKEGDADSHLILAEELLERIVSPQVNKTTKKQFTSMLSKLHVPPPQHTRLCTPSLAQNVHALVIEAAEANVATDATARNALARLATAVGRVVKAARETGDADADVTDVTATPDAGTPDEGTEGDSAPEGMGGRVEDTRVEKQEDEEEETTVQVPIRVKREEGEMEEMDMEVEEEEEEEDETVAQLRREMSEFERSEVESEGTGDETTLA